MCGESDVILCCDGSTLVITESADVRSLSDSVRVLSLRRRVRDAMEEPPAHWAGLARIADEALSKPLAVRKALAIALKLSAMPVDLRDGQLLAGSLTLESPRLHCEGGFPDYTTETEREAAKTQGLSIRSVFGHIVPDYGKLLAVGLQGIQAEARAQLPMARDDDQLAFLESVRIATQAVIDYAARLATGCREAAAGSDPSRASELRQMAANLDQAPAGPATSFHEALQAVWLVHMVFHATMNGNALGRLDQYVWPYLDADLGAGRLDLDQAMELTACFCLKFNERAKTTDEQRPDARQDEAPELSRRTRHGTSSQIGTRRDSLDATNHWLQNIVIGGLTPAGEDGTNLLSHLLLEAYRRQEMTNPLLTVRVHRGSPTPLLEHCCEVLKDGGGMPAIFNDEALVPALERLGIATADARDYTNDGCWEVIIPGRTDFGFQRLSLMLCLEWALNRGHGRVDEQMGGIDTGDPQMFIDFGQVWEAFVAQLDAMIGGVVRRVAATINRRASIAPVPLLSALIDGAIETRRDLTAGGAKYRTFGLLAESAAHAIDSLVAIRDVVFEHGYATMPELLDALEHDFADHGSLRARLQAAPKYGNDDPRADALGRQVVETFVRLAKEHAAKESTEVRFACGVGTFSWYVGIGQGLGASPDGRLAGTPVSSNFSPALGRDLDGLPAAILSYGQMPHADLPAGGPLDLRLARRLVEGQAGTDRMIGLMRAFVETGGSMMTLTVADSEELRAAQREPEQHRSLRVRMGGWSAYFTMLSREQQDHHIRRQEGGQ